MEITTKMFEKEETCIVVKHSHVNLAVSWIVLLLHIQDFFCSTKSKQTKRFRACCNLGFLGAFAKYQPIDM